MAAVLTGIVTFIYLLARMCCVQGQTPTGMLHDYTCMPFVKCTATFTTELALSVNMQEVVNNVPLVLLTVTETKSTCSVYNNFSLCTIHDTNNSSKSVTVKTFFPSELPRNASQFGCTVTRIYSNAQPPASTYLVNVNFESTTSTLTFTNPSTLSSSSATETGSLTPLPEHDCPKDHTVIVIVLAVLLAVISVIFIITTIILILRLKGNSDKRNETNLMLSETAPPNKYENVKNAQNNDLSASSKTKSPSLKLEVDVDDNGYVSTTGSSASTSANSGYSVPWNSDRLPVKPSPSLVRIKGYERKDNDLVKPSPSLVRIKGFERKDNDPVKPSHGWVHHERFDRKDNDPFKPSPGLVHHEGFDRKDNDPVKPSPGLVHHEGFERKDNDHVDEQEVCTESTPTKF